jgi:hypothetical protein
MNEHHILHRNSQLYICRTLSTSVKNYIEIIKWHIILIPTRHKLFIFENSLNTCPSPHNLQVYPICIKMLTFLSPVAYSKCNRENPNMLNSLHILSNMWPELLKQCASTVVQFLDAI